MNFIETPLKGAFIIELEEKVDERGFFARIFCKNEFNKFNLESNFVQINNKFTYTKGTFRGFHYQNYPNAEDKIIRCICGAMFNVIIDLRKDSETYCKWFGKELTATNRKMLYVPKGFENGMLTLEDNTEDIYLTTAFYSPGAEKGIRWDDPLFKIDWPIEPIIISDKDKSHLDYKA